MRRTDWAPLLVAVPSLSGRGRTGVSTMRLHAGAAALTWVHRSPINLPCPEIPVTRHPFGRPFLPNPHRFGRPSLPSPSQLVNARMIAHRSEIPAIGSHKLPSPDHPPLLAPQQSSPSMVATITIGAGADMPELPLLPGSYADDVLISVVGDRGDGETRSVTVRTFSLWASALPDIGSRFSTPWASRRSRRGSGTRGFRIS